MVPGPILLVLVLLLIVGATVVIETRLSVAGTASPSAAQDDGGASAVDPTGVSRGRTTSEKAREPRRGSRDEEPKFRRAAEIVAPAGFINTDSVSISEARGEKIVLVDFWTYACYNCQNTQPYLNAWHEEYADDGLLVIGVHTPEFGFERDPANVERAVREASIEYPVVLDNGYATWNAYDQRYWPAMYLIDADGYIRYKHFGEGAYGETEAKIRELLAESDRASG
ncbi:MAG TPA: redoxin domain-containing protein [Rubrobacter sp.]|nr:redoxin domain-containing protein [Rubrobacter sp.]